MSGTSANCWLPNAGTPSRLAFGHRGHKLSESGPSNIENEGSSGDVDENNERQVAGVRYRVSGPSAIGWLPNTAGPIPSRFRQLWANCAKTARLQYVENEGSSGDVDENNDRQVSGAKCRAPATSASYQRQLLVAERRDPFPPQLRPSWTNWVKTDLGIYRK